MGETIMREQCPKCNKYAYYNLGDLDDFTVDDSDGAECPRCGYKWLWEGVELEDRSDEDANYVLGQTSLQ